jgi:DNA-binding transcriptional LysR family regulator
MIQVPTVGARQYLDDGSLVEVLPEYKSRPMPVSLVYPNRRNVSKRVQVFMDWITELLKGYVG